MSYPSNLTSLLLFAQCSFHPQRLYAWQGEKCMQIWLSLCSLWQADGCLSSILKPDSYKNLSATLVGFGAKTVAIEWGTPRQNKYDCKIIWVLAGKFRAQVRSRLGTNLRFLDTKADCKVIWCPLMARILLTKMLWTLTPKMFTTSANKLSSSSIVLFSSIILVFWLDWLDISLPG